MISLLPAVVLFLTTPESCTSTPSFPSPNDAYHQITHSTRRRFGSSKPNSAFSSDLNSQVLLAMHRSDKSRYFLYIEPDPARKSAAPVEDALTQSLQRAFDQATPGRADYSNRSSKGDFTPSEGGWRGFHDVEDGTFSDTHDYLLPNGFITNSCCLHYARYYRKELPRTELKKLQQLHEFMQTQEKQL